MDRYSCNYLKNRRKIFIIRKISCLQEDPLLSIINNLFIIFISIIITKDLTSSIPLAFVVEVGEEEAALAELEEEPVVAVLSVGELV